MDQETAILPGRSCGNCTLCCKVLAITELGKPKGVWCKHCTVGRNCKIYERRPTECRTFHCGYLTWDALGEHWFPARSKMVVVFNGEVLGIQVDTDRPNAWRQQPYYSEIKKWAALAGKGAYKVVVLIGPRAILVLPDREVDLGLVADDGLEGLGEKPGAAA